MKKIFVFILVSCFALPLFSQTVKYASGYIKRDGTYVAPHYKTSPNSTKKDNFSSKGNINPFTGKKGTKKN